VFREIVDGQRAADGRRTGGQPPGERATIEVLRAVARDRGQRRRQRGLREASLGDAVGVVDRPQRSSHVVVRAGVEQRRRGRRDAPLACRDRDAVARVGDGSLQQGRPRDRRFHRLAAVAMRLPPSRDCAGHGQSGRAAARGNRVAEAPAIRLEVRGDGRPAGGVERA
jgi:hypothetical protein